MKGTNLIVIKKSLKILMIALYLSSYNANAQITDKYVLALHPSVGPSFPIGKSGELGTNLGGFSFKMELEAFFKNKFTVCAGMNNAFCVFNNDGLEDEIKRRHETSTDFQLASNAFRIDVDLSSYYLGGSLLLPVKNFLFQAKLDLNVGYLDYSFSGLSSETAPSITYYYTDYKARSYIGEGSIIFAVVPELNVSYVFFKRKWIHLALTAGANYFYANPTVTVKEKPYGFFSSGATDPMEDIKLKGPISTLNTQLGLMWILKFP